MVKCNENKECDGFEYYKSTKVCQLLKGASNGDTSTGR